VNDRESAQVGASARAAPDAAFDALLRRLRSSGSEALGYEALRRRLIQFFRLHVPADAEDLADVTLDRLARKIHEGTDVASVPLYGLGIARMVLHEARARSAKRRAAEADPTLFAEPDDGDTRATEDALLAALSACLDEAGTAARTLILAYYRADGAERIAIRQHLADERRISLNALRNRALRLREALENCVRGRLGWLRDA
jgi:DNA-directed RNA polymerase specialized sigma24 family protein